MPTFLKNIPHRLYLTWQEWLRKDWNRATKDNWYAAQVAYEVHTVLASQTPSYGMEKFLIKFNYEKPNTTEEPKEETAEEEEAAALRSYAIWAAAGGAAAENVNQGLT